MAGLAGIENVGREVRQGPADEIGGKSVEDLALFIVAIESTLWPKGNPHPRRRMSRPLRRPPLRSGLLRGRDMRRLPCVALTLESYSTFEPSQSTFEPAATLERKKPATGIEKILRPPPLGHLKTPGCDRIAPRQGAIRRSKNSGSGDSTPLISCNLSGGRPRGADRSSSPCMQTALFP